MSQVSNLRWPLRYLALGACCTLIALAGCGDSGPARYELTGTITYQGEPVPKGYIILAPDTQAGNSGPGATAEILDGRFATLEGQGTVGGPHTLQIYGYDGVPVEMPAGPDGATMTNPMGMPLFDAYSLNLDLPRADAEQTIALPVE